MQFDAQEYLQDLNDMYGDTLAQYDAEKALFGDAWTGADADLRRLQEALAEFDEALEVVEARVSPLDRAPSMAVRDLGPTLDLINFDDVPF